MDEISYRIKAYIQQFEPKTDLLDLFLQRCPLFYPLIGMIEGILFYRFVSIHNYVALTCISIVGLIFTVAVIRKAATDNRLYYYIQACILTFFILGLLQCFTYVKYFNSSQNLLGPKDRVLATIKGTILSKPIEKSNDQWYFAAFGHRQKHTNFYTSINSVQINGEWYRTRFKVFATLDGTIEQAALQAGDIVIMDCWLERPHCPDNDGQFDFSDFLFKNNIPLIASIQNTSCIQKDVNSPSSFLSRIKLKLLSIAYCGLDTDEEDASSGLIPAITLGDRSNVPFEILSDFKDTGLYHLLSLSGMHIGIVISSLWYGLRHLGVGRRKRSLLAILLAVAYMIVVPAKAPIIRACIICIVFFAGDIIKSKTNPFNSLFLAALILLAINPINLFRVDWLLSFSAVAGILFFSSQLITKFNLVTKCYFLTNSRDFHPVKKSIKYFAYSLCVSISAWLGSLGIILYNFQTINLLSAVWTVLALPAFYLLVVFSFFKILITAILPFAQLPINFLCLQLSNLLIWLVHIFNTVSFSSVKTAPICIIVILIVYAALLALRYSFHYSRISIKYLSLAIMTCSILYISSITFWPYHPSQTKLSILSVGHGQAICLTTSQGTNLLFDCGSASISDCSRKIITPFMKYNSITKIDSLFISHFDLDHYNGLDGVFDSVPVTSLYSGTGKNSKIESLCNSHGIEIHKCPQKIDYNKCVIAKIWPLTQNDIDISKNHLSDVLLLQINGKQILITGDIDKPAQKSILKQYEGMDIDIMILPHHGSAVTLDEAFVRSMMPEYVISSCSRTDLKHSFKTANINTGIVDYCTAEDGQIDIIFSDDGQIRIETKKDPLAASGSSISTN